MQAPWTSYWCKWSTYLVSSYVENEHHIWFSCESKTYSYLAQFFFIILQTCDEISMKLSWVAQKCVVHNMQCCLQSVAAPALLAQHVAAVGCVLSLCCVPGTVLKGKTAPLSSRDSFAYRVAGGSNGDSKSNCPTKRELGQGLMNRNLREWRKQGQRCSSMG